jgi:hypothetical protein
MSADPQSGQFPNILSHLRLLRQFQCVIYVDSQIAKFFSMKHGADHDVWTAVWLGADHGDGADALRDAVQDQGAIELIDAFTQQPVTQE